MSMITILELSVLALLASYLCRRGYLRHRGAWQQHREDTARERVFREDWQPRYWTLRPSHRRLKNYGTITLRLSILVRAQPATAAA
jgi:hypothetical protein